jgi:predicted acetyltransferase
MQIRPLRPGDAEQAFQLRVSAFSSATRATYDADEVYAPDEHRLVAVDGVRVVGHLAIWPVHQAFLGGRVPMGAVSAFAIAHDQRGSGIGSRMLAAALDHMADAELPISTLYPSTPVPYHRWGWEFAGEHIRRRVATRALLDVPEPVDPVVLRPYTPDDLDPLVVIRDRLALAEAGALIGGRRWLARLLQDDPDDADLVTVAVRDSHPVGLLSAFKTGSNTSVYGLHVRELFGVDRDVERALLRCVGHHHTVADDATVRLRSDDPLLFEIASLTRPDPRSEHFMTRLVDLPAAIAARRWPATSVTVALDVSDPRRRGNHGRFVLEVHDRAATLTRGGQGQVAIDIGALAALYTGFASVRGLAHAGRLRATDAEIVALVDAFNAPVPCMRDTF